MKKYLLTAILLFSISVNAQFKDPAFPTESPKDGIINNSSNSLFGFLSSDNFSMHHSFGISYSAFAGQGLSLATYTNSMMYKFTDNMNVQLDASFISSPYSTLGKDFQNSLQGVYISRAAFNYKPWEDVSISLQYRNLPYLYNNNYNGYYGSNFLRGNYGYDPFWF